MTEKVRSISELIADLNPAALCQIDGGVDASNARQLVDAGANVLVAGNAIFSKKNIPQAIRSLRAAASA